MIASATDILRGSDHHGDAKAMGSGSGSGSELSQPTQLTALGHLQAFREQSCLRQCS